jgi:hypothetical protein
MSIFLKQKVILAFFGVPPGTSLRTTSGTRTTGWWEPLVYVLEKKLSSTLINFTVKLNNKENVFICTN